ncbi:hypothetical protein [Cellulomonas endophytica]|uniref:hypothetical protein n=1 Tax=Cellulomonas endophytica TaxID=2494735 RepID=UPI0013E93C6E|nr:hypothetical protein [Cellulomonas endophytica]
MTSTPTGSDGPTFRTDEIPLLEDDETIAPRPEEEVADVARAEPDRAGHGTPG